MLNKRWTMPLGLLLAMVVLAWPAHGVSAQTPDRTAVYVDGQRVSTTAIVQNGFQLVPASFFRGLNVSVGWSERYRSAVLGTPAIQIGFPAGERHTDYQHAGAAAWQRDFLDTRTTLIGGIAYVPLAYTAKKLGLSVHYDTGKRAPVISTGESGPIALAKQSQPTDEELRWLYRITEAEAGGESYAGKVAVAASILNRVDHPDWPDTIIDTIFQVDYYNGKAYYQYSPVLDKRIHAVTPTQETIRAVRDALNGSDPGLGAIVFYNPDKTDNAWVRSRPVTVRIGNHIFAK
ncbi:cell wall hydrolase [Cohnella algarum]|uniref:cell wall hydrolase n=1 Tax=Cohnella algarum TaxID=2044859 RepID=UPI00196844DE|nr:cell wall hydrolase [Cohnella algarum]